MSPADSLAVFQAGEAVGREGGVLTGCIIACIATIFGFFAGASSRPNVIMTQEQKQEKS